MSTWFSNISNGLYFKAHTALTSVAMDYSGVDFENVASGYAPNRSKDEVAQLGAAVAPFMQ